MRRFRPGGVIQRETAKKVLFLHLRGTTLL
jgi:hypothetical protein